MMPEIFEYFHSIIYQHFFFVVVVVVDLKTVEERLEKNYYSTKKLFVADMSRIFANCRTYNGPDTEYYRCAGVVERCFQSKMKEFYTGLSKDKKIKSKVTV